MRLLKPLLAGATLLTLAVPALASAEPYYGDRGGDYGYSRDYGYGHDRGDHGRWDERRFHDGWRHRDYRRYHRHFWRYDRWDGGWR